jgi:hypothetical protein
VPATWITIAEANSPAPAFARLYLHNIFAPLGMPIISGKSLYILINPNATHFTMLELAAYFAIDIDRSNHKIEQLE